MTQQTLWNAAGQIVVNTRAEAAAAIANIKGTMQRQVLDYIARRGDEGATDEEIAYALRMRDSTARARRCELRDSGQVRDSQRRRRGCSGRLFIIWIATDQPRFDIDSAPNAEPAPEPVEGPPPK